MNKKKRTDIEKLWCALSDLFVDHEVPYHSMAKQIAHHDFNTIEFHLFYNVALVCGPNLSSAIPPVWAGFDEDAVIDDINKNGIMDDSQRTFRRNFWAWYYRWDFKKRLGDIKKTY